MKVPEWAESIIGQAIAEIAGGASDEEVIDKVKGPRCTCNRNTGKSSCALSRPDGR